MWPQCCSQEHQALGSWLQHPCKIRVWWWTCEPCTRRQGREPSRLHTYGEVKLTGELRVQEPQNVVNSYELAFSNLRPLHVYAWV